MPMRVAMPYHVDSHKANHVAAAAQSTDMAEIPLVPQESH